MYTFQIFQVRFKLLLVCQYVGLYELQLFLFFILTLRLIPHSESDFGDGLQLCFLVIMTVLQICMNVT